MRLPFKLYRPFKFSWPMLALFVAACTTAQVAAVTATVDAVLADVQSVCSAVLDDSTGSVATLISSFPLGTSALAIADTVCTYIDSVQPLPTTVTTPAVGAKLMKRAKAGSPLAVPLQSVTINGVTVKFAK
jgi:hypothetical protein